jgi:hypothetical protein
MMGQFEGEEINDLLSWHGRRASRARRNGINEGAAGWLVFMP